MNQTIVLESSKRDVSFDIARGIAIFLMILQHGWLIIVSGYVNNNWLDLIFFLLGTVLVAPIFLFLMGVNTVKSRYNKPKDLFKRGILLIFLGYSLSALRFFLPIILAEHFGLIAAPEDIIYEFSPLYYLLEVDILQVAGLSLIMIALLKWRKIKYNYYLIIAVLISLISPILWQLKFTSSSLNLLVAPFWGTDYYVVFPFFSWSLYSLVGVYFGNLLLKSKNKKEFYKDCLTKITPLGVISLIFLILDSLVFDSSYNCHSLGYNLLLVSIIITWLAVINLNYHKISVKLINILTVWSKNVTIIYFVQWILIAWTAILINILG